MFSAIWRTWQHGVVLALIYGLGMFMALIGLSLAVMLVDAILGLMHMGIPQDEAINIMPKLFPIWGPLGIGYVAPHVPLADEFE